MNLIPTSGLCNLSRRQKRRAGGSSFSVVFVLFVFILLIVTVISVVAVVFVVFLFHQYHLGSYYTRIFLKINKKSIIFIDVFSEFLKGIVFDAFSDILHEFVVKS